MGISILDHNQTSKSSSRAMSWCSLSAAPTISNSCALLKILSTSWWRSMEASLLLGSWASSTKTSSSTTTLLIWLKWPHRKERSRTIYCLPLLSSITIALTELPKRSGWLSTVCRWNEGCQALVWGLGHSNTGGKCANGINLGNLSLK